MKIHRSKFVVASLLGLCLWAQSPAPAPSAPQNFGGTYQDLRPEQKRLVDDWFQRFSAVVKKQVDPAEGYAKLPLSTKTTFNAVTHALLNTKLTDEAGKSLAPSALALVDKVDSAAGEVLGARGDQQFRIYVQMKPGAIDLLNRSEEFKHTADNTVYHKGYPTCFRTKGTPSIQISLTRDNTRADIDVDYRSSKFPVALMNGHLTASNSDVRAGDNDDRHNVQWAGLQNWWRNLLGLPLTDTSSVRVGETIFTQEPRRKESKPADAIYDFLQTWLVEQKPNESFAYFAEDAFKCLELGKEPSADRGMSKFVVVEKMIAANQQVGSVTALRDVSQAVAISGERLKVIDQPHSNEFALYKVREDLAEQFNCANRVDAADISPKAARSHDFDKYVGAVFRLQTKGQVGTVLATVWRKDNGYWKMVSYAVDPELDRNGAPNVGSEPAVSTLEVVEADKDLLNATSTFLTTWLVKRDVDGAMRYLSPDILACAVIYRSDRENAHASDDPRMVLQDGMQKIASQAGQSKTLEEVIVAPEVHHEALKLVKHRDPKAFVIVSIPEYMGEAARCDRRDEEGNPVAVTTVATGYGRFYATGFTLHQGRANPAVLWIVWSKTSGDWKANSFVVVVP